MHPICKLPIKLIFWFYYTNIVGKFQYYFVSFPKQKKKFFLRICQYYTIIDKFQSSERLLRHLFLQFSVFFDFVFFPFALIHNKKISRVKTRDKSKSIVYIRKQSNLTGTLDSGCQLALMSSAGACCTARKYLSTLRNKLAKTGYILVIYGFNAIYAKMTHFFVRFSASRAFIFFLFH